VSIRNHFTPNFQSLSNCLGFHKKGFAATGARLFGDVSMNGEAQKMVYCA
jgi:hypothetical protein